jgi:hypothetical protein
MDWWALDLSWGRALAGKIGEVSSTDKRKCPEKSRNWRARSKISQLIRHAFPDLGVRETRQKCLDQRASSRKQAP